MSNILFKLDSNPGAGVRGGGGSGGEGFFLCLPLFSYRKKGKGVGSLLQLTPV